MVYTDCTNCGAGIVAFEPHVCMQCGQPLCDECYEESPYCKVCEPSDEQEVRSGECIECGRFAQQLLNGSCEGCVMQAIIDAQA